jgi:hypothetical protein
VVADGACGSLTVQKRPSIQHLQRHYLRLMEEKERRVMDSNNCFQDFGGGYLGNAVGRTASSKAGKRSRAFLMF